MKNQMKVLKKFLAIVSNSMPNVIVFNVHMAYHVLMTLKVVNDASVRIHVAIINVAPNKIVPLISNHQHNMVQNLYQFVAIVQNEEDVHNLLMIHDANVNVILMLIVVEIQNVVLLVVVLFVWHLKRNIGHVH